MSKYNRNEILQAGIDILTQNGYSGLGVQHVLKQCGIPKGSFYNFFENKDAFVLEALKLYDKHINEQLQSIDQEEISPMDKILKYYKNMNEFFFNDGDIKTCPMMNVVSDNVENEMLLYFINDGISGHRSYIDKWIYEGIESGQIPKKHSPEILALMLYDNYQGAVLRMKYELSKEPLKQFIEVVIPFYLSK